MYCWRRSIGSVNGPKTEVADWYRSTILEAAWGFPPECFRSQDFWDALEQILPEGLDPLSRPEDPWDQAQLRLLDCGKKSRWRADAYSPTTPPISIPTSPATIPALNWRSVVIISRAGISYARSVSDTF